MKLFGVEMVEMIPHEKGKPTKKRKSIRLFGKDLVPQRSKSRIKKTRSSSTASPSDPPSALLQAAQGMREDFVFLTRKILERSDVNVGLNRLFVPKTPVLLGLLSPEERREVEGGGGVEVGVVDMRGERYSMMLKKWGSLNQIVLNRGWRKLVENNGLRAELDTIELWTFRADLKLCFALNVKSEGDHH